MKSFDNSNNADNGNHSGIRVSYFSHPGLARGNNEDSFLLLPQYGLWAVADGMGGHNCGEVASAIAIATLRQDIGKGASLVAAIQNSHKAIQTEAAKDPLLNGMGSTVVAVKIAAGRFQAAWVGDSRAYLWRSKLQRLTKDHSVVQMMLDQGLIDEREALAHPYKSVITQALGVADSDSVMVDTVENSIEKGDILLLCSDGLNSEVPDAQIEAILASDADLEQKTQQLVAAALANGGNDNITVILLAI
jgi:protein phosphatase